MNRKLSEGKQEKKLDNANTLRSLTLDNFIARNCGCRVKSYGD
jgi:hypothetical protein